MVTSAEGSLTLSTLGRMVHRTPHVLTYTHLAACPQASIVVGIRMNNAFVSGAAAETPPTRIDLWEVISPTSGAGSSFNSTTTGRLHPIGSIEGVNVCPYALRVSWEYVGGGRRLAIVVIGSDTRLAGHPPNIHWVGRAGDRALHQWQVDLWHREVEYSCIPLPRGMEPVYTLEIDERYIFVPSTRFVHIYDRVNHSLVLKMPSPPLHAAAAYQVNPQEILPALISELHPALPLPVRHYGLVGYTMGTRPYFRNITRVHSRPMTKRKDDHAKVRCTRNDLVVLSPAGAVIVIRNYRAALASLATIPVEHRESAIVPYTVIIATHHPVSDFATHNDQIALRFSHNFEIIVCIDAWQLPDLPFAASTPANEGSSSAEGSTSEGRTSTAHVLEDGEVQEAEEPEEPLPTVPCPPMLHARVIRSRRDRDCLLKHAMHMDATGIFYPATHGVKCHLFGFKEGRPDHLLNVTESRITAHWHCHSCNSNPSCPIACTYDSMSRLVHHT
jgi:hypothetical protein